jgi:hypothetical protein
MEQNNPVTKKALMNADAIAALLQNAARAQQVISYSELMQALGISMTKPKQRALSKILETIDLAGQAKGEPELACLVVREENNLPGQGWWDQRHDFVGDWESHAARRYLKELQKTAFDYWQAR